MTMNRQKGAYNISISIQGEKRSVYCVVLVTGIYPMYKNNYKNNQTMLFLLFIFSTGVLWARDVSISVQDKDLEQPLEGAVIHSWDNYEYICDGEGKALISVPDERQVIIQVTYPGYETGRMLIPPAGNIFSLMLEPGNAIESRALVIEAERPGTGETRSGRSVAISGEVMEQSSQIGLIEDVMTSIKLLPGVGYAGFFNAMPSIRGGDPEDLIAIMDGFYIENPYHWGGGFSIFDPHMTKSAQLSHGIYSARYGHTISGLLEISSKKASPDHAEMELGISTSAVNLNAAIPFGNRDNQIKGGGLMLMGKVTYWDPFVLAMQQLSKSVESDLLDTINGVETSPYIRSGAASFNYRFNSDLEINANTFIGTDGIGLNFPVEVQDPSEQYSFRSIFDWSHLQMFFLTGISHNPVPSLVYKISAGAGYEQQRINAKADYDYLKIDTGSYDYELGGSYLNWENFQEMTNFNVQGRIDFDWSLGRGFIMAAGVSELYSQYTYGQNGSIIIEQKETGPYPPYINAGETYYRQFPADILDADNKNHQFNSSAYMLSEYSSPENRFGAELGLRLDHSYYQSENRDAQTKPIFNPRLNLDFNILRDKGIVESLDITAGTGLFSSVNLFLPIFLAQSNDEEEPKPNRSWTSVLGFKTSFYRGWDINIEGFFKYVYDRTYIYNILQNGEASYKFNFDGKGIIWGFDLMIRKYESRYWDSWITYTFTHARYYEGEKVADDFVTVVNQGWYYPEFHRFHNFNLVMNFKPSKKFNIFTRFGFASGQPKPVVGEITEYKVVAEDGNGNSKVINKYYRESRYSPNSRTTWSFPFDLKFSYLIFNPRNKAQTEMYLGAENILSLVYRPKGNTTFNPYTGKEDPISDSPDFALPIPMVSVGVKWSY